MKYIGRSREERKWSRNWRIGLNGEDVNFGLNI
jgi:hypothetical protein